MTRSHVLLHCLNDGLRVAREKAWEGKDPGGVRVLLANPRWEKRLLRFLELSGAGKRRRRGRGPGSEAGRVDNLKDEGEGTPTGANLTTFSCVPLYSSFYYHFFC